MTLSVVSWIGSHLIGVDNSPKGGHKQQISILQGQRHIWIENLNDN